MQAMKGIPKGIRLLVCGGRNYWHWEHAFNTLDQLHKERGIGVLIAGGATGADMVAARWAELRGVQAVICPAPWNGEHGRGAGPVRNAFMLTLEPDLVMAFPGGPGTKNMVEQAETDGIFVIKIDSAGKVR